MVCIFINKSRVTTIARSPGLAVDNCLNRKIKRSCEFKSALYNESVSKGTSGSLGPTGATVPRNLLVFVP